MGLDRALITIVLLAITFVLLMTGFVGPSVYFTLPGIAGWFYIGMVIVASSGALAWLFCVYDRVNARSRSGLRTLRRKSNQFLIR